MTAPADLRRNRAPATTEPDQQAAAPSWTAVDAHVAAGLTPTEVFARLDSGPAGLTGAEVLRRRATTGRNAIRVHRAQALPVLLAQLRSPLLVLLALTATASFFVGERTDSLIIGVILGASVGLGFGNEYRAERAAEALHSRITHQCVVRRDGSSASVDVTELVPGDVVELRLGEVVPADLRLIDTTGLECDESVLTGESLPASKRADAVIADAAMSELAGCALMGTVVQAGSGVGVAVATGDRAVFGRIAVGLGTRPARTQFQLGLQRYSMLLVRVAAALTVAIFVVNVALRRPVLDAMMFSLAIAVGISPQLLPAVVSTSLAAGAHQLARRKVLVKRLVCIEDLGDVSVLFTDKTGTLTDGHVRFMRSLGPDGRASARPVLDGLLCNEATVEDGVAVAGSPLDVAIWRSPAAGPFVDAARRHRRLGLLPFDHDRRMASAVVESADGGRRLIVKGAPEAVIERCRDAGDGLRAALAAEFAAGNRVIAVGSRDVTDLVQPTAQDERDLRLDGLLVFLDPPKPDARAALDRLDRLGIEVKVVTGDNAAVARHLCADVGIDADRVVTGPEIRDLADDRLVALVEGAKVFARVSPEDKARIVRAQRSGGHGVAFLGDGVNDALALHAADVGISVDSATDVAKDAADVILLEKDLDVLADGVVEGRRIFANTIKYVLMGTSSNFGNMFSAAGASAFLSFLPMLPSQILLNNLLYDASQLAIPTDTVDAELLARPSHWDTRAIRRFMLFFGPISSLFDLATFAVMLWILHAQAPLFRTGWFVESLATQTLVVFAIRTRRIPFFRSAPSIPLLIAALGVVLTGVVLPFTPVAHELGFRALPARFFVALVVMVACYLLLIEAGKARFYPTQPAPEPRRVELSTRRTRRVHRRAARFTVRRSDVGIAERRRQSMRD